MCLIQCCLNHLAASPPEADSTVACGPSERAPGVVELCRAAEGSAASVNHHLLSPWAGTEVHCRDLPSRCNNPRGCWTTANFYTNHVPKLFQSVLFLPRNTSYTEYKPHLHAEGICWNDGENNLQFTPGVQESIET